MNELDEKIKFTMDVEEEERLAFLDVELIRSTETLKWKLLKKNLYAGILLNFKFHHKYKMKIGILRSMIIRSLRLTDGEFWDEELEKFTRISLGNGYPREVIQRYILAVKSQWRDGDHERKIKMEKESVKWIVSLPVN
ncbi:unnamed protein product [Protopolystoma xenopodis]|uniref:Helix-turn-helix domain-containing protein n=1 Tax=Protopolystoma xenopodis TaxID=117903 RepID=A0A3S5A891_9PLAT|nr:unnamed protein product [Protopolystoma xenopodis]